MSSRAVALLEGPLLGEGSAEGGVLQEVMASGVLLEGEASAEPSSSHAPAGHTALCRALCLPSPEPAGCGRGCLSPLCRG